MLRIALIVLHYSVVTLPSVVCSVVRLLWTLVLTVVPLVLLVMIKPLLTLLLLALDAPGLVTLAVVGTKIPKIAHTAASLPTCPLHLVTVVQVAVVIAPAEIVVVPLLVTALVVLVVVLLPETVDRT